MLTMVADGDVEVTVTTLGPFELLLFVVVILLAPLEDDCDIIEVPPGPVMIVKVTTFAPGMLV